MFFKSKLDSMIGDIDKLQDKLNEAMTAGCDDIFNREVVIVELEVKNANDKMKITRLQHILNSIGG